MQNLIVAVFLSMTKSVKVGPQPRSLRNVATVRQLMEENRTFGNSKPPKSRQARSVGSKTGSVCTIPLEEQKTINVDSNTTIRLPSVLEKVREKRPEVASSCTVTTLRRTSRIRQSHFSLLKRGLRKTKATLTQLSANSRINLQLSSFG
ncbi:hypothetical protein EVAR_21516_1 [Eumeta japonica]|uniref:Uncharacterized protein n=1 Tax=Eumeta variegata TaxID=151549 RepID=A0A4C1UYY7_EUMVA|nr:hypothetical protein EVAR_21516_1 [Eumeta japonica]